MLVKKIPDFISLTLWSLNRLDLNLMDYKVWLAMQEMFYKQQILEVDELFEYILIAYT